MVVLGKDHLDQIAEVDDLGSLTICFKGSSVLDFRISIWECLGGPLPPPMLDEQPEQATPGLIGFCKIGQCWFL